MLFLFTALILYALSRFVLYLVFVHLFVVSNLVWYWKKLKKSDLFDVGV